MNRYFLFALLAVLAMSFVIAAAPWQWSVGKDNSRSLAIWT